MYMRTHMYISVHMYIHVQVFIHNVCMYMHAWVCTCMCVHVCIRNRYLATFTTAAPLGPEPDTLAWSPGCACSRALWLLDLGGEGREAAGCGWAERG